MSREVQTQRAYKIPKGKLNLFLTAIDVNWNNSNSRYEANFIFDETDSYCVVLNEYGLTYPFMLKEIKNFVNDLWESEADQ